MKFYFVILYFILRVHWVYGNIDTVGCLLPSKSSKFLFTKDIKLFEIDTGFYPILNEYLEAEKHTSYKSKNAISYYFSVRLVDNVPFINILPIYSDRLSKRGYEGSFIFNGSVFFFYDPYKILHIKEKPGDYVSIGYSIVDEDHFINGYLGGDFNGILRKKNINSKLFLFILKSEYYYNLTKKERKKYVYY